MSHFLTSKILRAIAVRSYSAQMVDTFKIGNREIVGFGMQGTPTYIDSSDAPMPAVRFRPETPDIKELRVKEKGDWKNLSVAEKKALYRASFCQTFAEMEAPTGEWKSVVGITLFFASFSLWIFMFFKLFVYNPTLPESFSEERKRAQLRRILDMKIDPITGISSKWDYEKDDWKK